MRWRERRLEEGLRAQALRRMQCAAAERRGDREALRRTCSSSAMRHSSCSSSSSIASVNLLASAPGLLTSASSCAT